MPAPGLAWDGLAWPALAWPRLAWLGIAWLGFAQKTNFPPKHPSSSHKLYNIMIPNNLQSTYIPNYADKHDKLYFLCHFHCVFYYAGECSVYVCALVFSMISAWLDLAALDALARPG